MSERKQLVVALLVAALASDVFSVACWRRTWRAFKAIGGLFIKGQQVPDDIYQRRLVACRGCSVFYAPLQTCGSPFSDWPDLGCWCHMPTKARQVDATCWLDDEMDESFCKESGQGWRIHFH